MNVPRPAAFKKIYPHLFEWQTNQHTEAKAETWPLLHFTVLWEPQIPSMRDRRLTVKVASGGSVDVAFAPYCLAASRGLPRGYKMTSWVRHWLRHWFSVLMDILLSTAHPHCKRPPAYNVSYGHLVGTYVGRISSIIQWGCRSVVSLRTWPAYWRWYVSLDSKWSQVGIHSKSSAVAEMADRLATIDMGRKVGRGCCGGRWVTI